jgi:hypothetical protein
MMPTDGQRNCAPCNPNLDASGITMLKNSLALAVTLAAMASGALAYGGECATCGGNCQDNCCCQQAPTTAPRTLCGYELRCIRQTNFLETACCPMCLPKYVHCCPTCDTCHTAAPKGRHVGENCGWYGNIFGLPPKVRYHANK